MLLTCGVDWMDRIRYGGWNGVVKVSVAFRSSGNTKPNAMKKNAQK